MSHFIQQGKVWRYGSNIDTDAIIPGRYCHLTDPAELARHCFKDLDPEFAKGVRRGDVIVAGSNFGCGSSREIAPVAIKAAGICCVVAVNFARIFFRNAINIGLPIFEIPEAPEVFKSKDPIQVDLRRGLIRNLRDNSVLQATPFPDFIQEIIRAGGLMAYIKQRLG
jgi:3-isopropylmalate/(R)-2-methylmalate dehydratase small subunit